MISRVGGPIRTRYVDLETCTHNPLYHALDVIAGVIDFISIRHPLLFYGALTVVAFAIFIAFGV
jgi:hypothetical protein